MVELTKKELKALERIQEEEDLKRMMKRLRKLIRKGTKRAYRLRQNSRQ